MQKFNKGDRVQVVKDLGQSMSHFTNDCEAIVIGSYKDQFGGDNTNSYTIHIKGKGETSWYYEHQLELIEADRIDLLEIWERERQQEIDTKSDLDWIFSNGKEVLKEPHGASIAALAKCFGLTNLWGSRGEGITYYSNAMGTLDLAAPFLEAGDKEGWIKHCKTMGRITNSTAGEAPLLMRLVIFNSRNFGMGTELKVRNLIDSTYQVIEFYLNGDGEYEDESVLYQGSLSDCEAYIRLKNSDLLV